MLQVEFKEFPLLHTNRLYLRKPGLDDLSELYALRSDERVMNAIGKPLSTLPEVKDLIGRMQDDFNSGNGITWAMALEEGGRLIGTIGLWRIVKPHHRAEIGYMLHPDYHRRGFMKEAMKAVLDFGFNTLKLHSIEAILGAKNEGSKALLESCGFVQEGYFKENFFFNGKFEDSRTYSLLAGGR